LQLDRTAVRDVDRNRRDEVLQLRRVRLARGAALDRGRAERLARVRCEDAGDEREVDRGLAEVADADRAAGDRIRERGGVDHRLREAGSREVLRGAPRASGPRGEAGHRRAATTEVVGDEEVARGAVE